MKKTLILLGLTLAFTTHHAVAATAAGTVNGITITVEEANSALNTLTKGQKTWEKLTAAEKKQLIEMMAPAKLVAAESKKSLSDKEKEAALAGFWMQKKMATTEVTDKEAEDAYNKMKKAAEDAKSTQTIPPFDAVKNNIKMQLAQEKVVTQLMKNANIKIK
ncbi:hypothetical protein PF327_01175 [Sulfurovum sp. XTW-4]|uniref:Periplasmic chaperone for outer membrane proteins Skp n=1 Tax=Sulfurovum xiamenensis TaxID=3019066 RepID=A0ABT7QPI7_9BACT|nr:hypothetical protein [Sulfurovum xiamenensis]MDM5262799.1 hypothetical protein [Sulfurovum xiamenensis]